MKQKSSKFELVLTIVGLIALTALAIFLSILEQNKVQVENEEIMQVQESTSARDQVYQSYQDYRLLEAEDILLLSRSFEDSVLSNWQPIEEAQDDAIVSELRIHTFSNKLRFVVLVETSPSGDWLRETEYYFNEDKTIGVISSRLNTFYGNVRVLEERVYLEGELLEQKKSTMDLETDELVDRSYQDQPIEIFLTIDDLQAYIGSAVLLQPE